MPFRMFLHLKDGTGQNKRTVGSQSGLRFLKQLELAVNLSSVGASPKEAVVPTASATNQALLVLSYVTVHVNFSYLSH